MRARRWSLIVHRIKNNKEVDIMTYVTLFLNKTKIQIKIRKLKPSVVHLRKIFQVQIAVEKVHASRGRDAISIGQMTQLYKECVTSTPTWVDFCDPVLWFLIPSGFSIFS